MKIIWILVNCNSRGEADKIGRRVLAERLSACFDVVPRIVARYFWPPRSGKIESAKGCVLILTTAKSKTRQIHTLVKKLHSDKVPFISSIELKDVNPDYVSWLTKEIDQID